MEHRKNHTHLSYVLQLPHHYGKVQEAFGIGYEDSFILAIKNPDQYMHNLPEHLKKVFHGRVFCPVNPPELLNYKGLQLLLIGATEFTGQGEPLLDETMLEEFRNLEYEAQTAAPYMSSKTLLKELHLGKDVKTDSLTHGEFV